MKEIRRQHINAGLAVRRQIRRYLLSMGIKFIEDKGWIDSVFYFDCDHETWKRISADLNAWEKSFNY